MSAYISADIRRLVRADAEGRCYSNPCQRLLLLVFLTIFVMAVVPAPPASAKDLQAWYTFTSDNGLAGNIVQSIWEDPQGRIWFGTENGASRYDGQSWVQYRSQTSDLIDNNVWSIAGDASTVWFATSNGVSRLEGDTWTHYSVDDGLPNSDVRAVLVGRDGSVWAGTFGGGVARLQRGAARWETLPLPEILEITDLIASSIWQAPNGDLWFSTSSIGALRLRNNTWDSFNFRQANRNTVWSIGGIGENVWLATFRGIVLVDRSDAVSIITDVAEDVPIEETEVLAVAAEPDGTLWFGTRSQGVLRFADGNWERFSIDDGLSRTYVQSALVDSSGRVWFGTRGGGVTMRASQPAAGALKTTISMQDIASGEQLVLGEEPLRFDQNNLQFSFSVPITWAPAQAVSFRYWLSRAGAGEEPLPRDVRSPAAPAIEARSDIQDFINLPPGRYTLHVIPSIGETTGEEARQSFTILGAPPRISADEVSIQTEAGGPIPRGATLGSTLFETTRRVELLFTPAEGSGQDDPHTYAYRVVGHDTGWIKVDGTRAALDLPVGTYHIEVQASDREGLSSAPVELTVIVPGPLWVTILLALLAVLVPGICGGAIGVIGYRRWSRRQALLRAVRGHVIPYDVGPLITTPERYIGRRHVLDAILGRIEHNSFYVYGERRIGKTSLLALLKQLLEQRNALSADRVSIPVFRNIQDLPQEQFWPTLIRSTADTLETRPPLIVDERADLRYNDLDAQDDFEQLIAQAEHIYAPRRPLFVLLVDEIDTIERFDPVVRQRFRAFCQHLQEHVQAVLVGVLPPRSEPGDTSPWNNIFAPVTLGPIDLADTLHLIRDYNHNPYHYTPEAEQALIKAGDRKPFDTQWLCAEAVKAMLAAGRQQIELADVALATRTLERERRREYAAFWQQASPELRADLAEALANDGQLAHDKVSIGRYDQLFEAGLALSNAEGHRLTYLFQSWLREAGGL